MFSTFNCVKKFSNNFTNNNFNKPTLPLSRVVCYRCLRLGHYAGQCSFKKVKDIKEVIEPLKTKIMNHLHAFKKIIRILQKETSETMPLLDENNYMEYIENLTSYLQDASHQWAENLMESQELKKKYEELKISILIGEKSKKSIQNKNLALNLINKKQEKEIAELKKSLSEKEKLQKFQKGSPKFEVITTGFLEKLTMNKSYDDVLMQKTFSINPNSLNKKQKVLLGMVRTRIRNQVDGKDLNDSSNVDPLWENYINEKKKRELQKEKTEWSKLQQLEKIKEKEEEKIRKEKERIEKEKERKEQIERRKRFEEERIKLEKSKIENIQKFNQKKMDDYEKLQKQKKIQARNRNYMKMKKLEMDEGKRNIIKKKEVNQEEELSYVEEDFASDYSSDNKE